MQLDNQYLVHRFFRNLEYDDGNGAENGDDYQQDYSDNLGGHHNVTPNKRKYDNGPSTTNDDENEAIGGDDDAANTQNGESSSTSSGADTVPKKKRRKEFMNLNATFMAGVQGVHLVTDQPRLGVLQKTIQDMCKFKNNGFPGSQPVSMDMNNIQLLGQKPYRVSWKADGARYMMLIHKENEVYFFDRDNSCFQVTGMRFPYREDINEHIYETLIDGEMVIDKVNGLSIPRYLVYDIIYFNGVSYMENEFYSEQSSITSRLKCIKENIIGKNAFDHRNCESVFHFCLCFFPHLRTTPQCNEIWPYRQAT